MSVEDFKPEIKRLIYYIHHYYNSSRTLNFINQSSITEHKK